MDKNILTEQLKSLSNEIVYLLKKNSLNLATMEDCTSGLICTSLIDVYGSEKVIEGGIMAHTDNQKILSGVSFDVIRRNGAYSRECALDMAIAVKKNSSTSIGIGVTGQLFSKQDSKSNIVHFAIKIGENIIANSFEIDKTLKSKKTQRKFITYVVLMQLKVVLTDYISKKQG